MNKLKYEQAVAERSKRGIARTNVADEVKSYKITQSIRDQFEKEKRAAPKKAVSKTVASKTAAPKVATPKVAASKEGAQQDSAVKKSGCQSNFNAVVKPSKLEIRRTASATKFKTTSIAVRQLSHETAMIKSPEENSEVFSKKLAKCPSSMFISEPEINESDTPPHDYDEDIQNDQPDDEPNLKDNDSMEQLPEVDTNRDSREVSDGNSYLKTEELINNVTSAETEHVDDDTPRELEFSDETSISEPNHDLVSSCLKSESNVLMEEPKDPILVKLSEESFEYNELQISSSNDAMSLLDSNQENIEAEYDLLSSCLEAESIVLMEKPKNPIVAEFPEEILDNSELQIPTSNDAVPLLDFNQEKIESTKSLRARFEALQNNSPTDKPTPKSNRISKLFENQVIINCESCEKKVYPLEKIEIESRVYHRTCFRCSHCQCLLRMDSFTRNCNRMYCMPHFKQLFKTSGNYEQGFSDV